MDRPRQSSLTEVPPTSPQQEARHLEMNRLHDVLKTLYLHPLETFQILTLGTQHFRQRWSRRLRYFYYRFVRLRATPEAIARGLATGVFAGCFPFFGLQTIIGITLAALLRGSKLVAAAGTWVSNPFTYFPLFAFNFHVGQWVLGNKNDSIRFVGLESWQEVMDLGTDLIVVLFVGSFIVGIVSAVFSYFVGLWVVYRLRKRYRNKTQR